MSNAQNNLGSTIDSRSDQEIALRYTEDRLVMNPSNVGNAIADRVANSRTDNDRHATYKEAVEEYVYARHRQPSQVSEAREALLKLGIDVDQVERVGQIDVWNQEIVRLRAEHEHSESTFSNRTEESVQSEHSAHLTADIARTEKLAETNFPHPDALGADRPRKAATANVYARGDASATGPVAKPIPTPKTRFGR